MRFEVPEQKKLTHEMVIPIRWGDMDAMGHVNNTVYFRYLEIVRIEWLHRAGGAPDRDGSGPVIVNAFCNFIRQLQYPGDVRARHYVANAGRTSSTPSSRSNGPTSPACSTRTAARRRYGSTFRARRRCRCRPGCAS